MVLDTLCNLNTESGTHLPYWPQFLFGGASNKQPQANRSKC